MVIDEEILKDGINEKLIAELINRHGTECGRIKRLIDYYLGKHEILNRERIGDKTDRKSVV